MKNTLLLSALVLCLLSCSDEYKNKYEKAEKELVALKTENERLLGEVKTLGTDIEGYKNTPQKLFANATKLYEDKQVTELYKLKNSINKYHPESSEAAKVNDMYDKLDASLEKQKEEVRKREMAEKEAAEKKRMQAVNKLKKKFDDVSGDTWYSNPYFTHYTNTNLTSLYIGQSGSSVWLRLQMSYYGDDWIFFETAYLSYDGQTKVIEFDKYKDKETDHDSSVWEWIDIRVDDDLLAFLREMSNGKSIKMRLSGKYTKTRNLSAKEINGIKDVLLAYDVLKNGQ